MDEAILSKFHSSMKPYIEELLAWEDTGLSDCKVAIDDVQSGAISSITTTDSYGDRFKLRFTLAYQQVSWEVIMNYNNTQCPPDFIFDDVNFMTFLMEQPIKEKLPSLLRWDKEDKTTLLRVVKEFIAVYKEYQISLIKGSSRIEFEYSSLTEEMNIPTENIEVMQNTLNRNGPIFFLIKIPMDYTPMSRILREEDDMLQETAMILVRFNSMDVTQITTDLILTPILDSELDGIVKCPKFPKGGCLLDYVPDVIEHLESNINFLCDAFDARKKCITHLAEAFKDCVLEYDAGVFSKISYLFEWNDFFFIVQMSLSKKFPKVRPSFQFQSVFHMHHGKPYASRYDNGFPYNPNWNMEDFTSNLRTFVLDTIPGFQRNSLRYE